MVSRLQVVVVPPHQCTSNLQSTVARLLVIFASCIPDEPRWSVWSPRTCRYLDICPDQGVGRWWRGHHQSPAPSPWRLLSLHHPLNKTCFNHLLSIVLFSSFLLSWRVSPQPAVSWGADSELTPIFCDGACTIACRLVITVTMNIYFFWDQWVGLVVDPVPTDVQGRLPLLLSSAHNWLWNPDMLGTEYFVLSREVVFFKELFVHDSIVCNQCLSFAKRCVLFQTARSWIKI